MGEIIDYLAEEYDKFALETLESVKTREALANARTAIFSIMHYEAHLCTPDDSNIEINDFLDDFRNFYSSGSMCPTGDVALSVLERVCDFAVEKSRFKE